MLGASASLLNIPIIILDQGLSPAKQVLANSSHVDGSFSDPAKIRDLAEKVDVLTVEIEHVDVEALEEVQKAFPKVADPSEPQHCSDDPGQICSEATSRVVGCSIGIVSAIEKFGFPLMLKSRTLASKDDIPSALSALPNRTLYAEKWVMVVKTREGETRSYPAVETIHKDNICHLVYAPLRTRDATLVERAKESVFGVEMFLLEDGKLRTFAPRPHNSGHYTIEACYTSQYENHLRAILGLPLGSTELEVPSAVMLNLIGFSSSLSEIEAIVTATHAIPGTTVHLYGKAECRKGRKMGHITIVGDSDAQVIERLRPLLLAAPSSSRTNEEIDLYAPLTPAFGSGHSSPNPLVGIIMGSDSDLPVMLPAARILDSFQVPYELTVVSAHRTPQRMVEYSKSAASRGLRVIIAGAGGAAHLPGMVAALTALPVVGVPVKLRALDGVDSLYSIKGIPVATVAINNGTNAGLLAVRMLGIGLPRLVAAMEEYFARMEKEVLGKVEKLEEHGWEEYTVRFYS
ncbi:Phosphoribosylaminoimidazole carboxylase pure domain-containing protein [Flagelloscypha sp. PMI_526]|nr:Phosphoribosylaminoimidazole carboxylase pure domain-containing protein [Flagelloscypha sp. PMI_526]